jgi:hypothetical protein
MRNTKNLLILFILLGGILGYSFLLTDDSPWSEKTYTLERLEQLFKLPFKSSLNKTTVVSEPTEKELLLDYNIGTNNGRTINTDIASGWAASISCTLFSEICGNGIDDDGDGLIDCEDSDCYLAANSGDIDTDGDGIGNICDIDDDGDGILDIDEVVCPAPSSNTISSFIISNEPQIASSKTVTSTSNTSGPFSSSTNYTVNYGTNIGKKMEGVVLTSGDSVKINTVAASGAVFFRRNTSGPAPSNEIIWIENDGSSSSSNARNMHLTEPNMMEEAMSYGYYNIGGDNLFNNNVSAQNFTNIERVDVVFQNGVKVKSPSNEYVTIAERGINNTIDIAIITGIDGSGVPTSYSPVHTILASSLINVETFSYTISRKEPADTEFRPVLGQTQSVGVSVVDLSTFGISVGTTIYGYSVLPPDYNTSNIVDWNTYPTNTNDNVGGIDLVLFNYLYTSCVAIDTDGDGITDDLDIDADDDGITDLVESQGNNYTAPSGVDSDNDGLDDAFDNDIGNIDPTLSAGITPVNTDGTGNPNYLDIDADDDGIPDNIEGQTTANYIPPSGIDLDNDGLDDAYDNNTSNQNSVLSAGISPVNTDGTDNVDYLDLDSDNDAIPDIQENGDIDNTLSGNDTDNDGLDDNFDSDNVNWDVNDRINDPNPSTLGDSDNDVAADGNNAIPLSGDVDYRDAPEICNNGIDDDGDGLIDCADPECGKITISNKTLSACINHPYADVATLSVTVTWGAGTPNEIIEVSIAGKTEYIDVPNGATSPATVSFVVPANGSTGNTITAKFKTYTCQATTTYNAPVACSNDKLNCSMLYICGDSKGSDADAFDHGLMQYIDGINGNEILIGALSKNVAGQGLYNPNSTSTLTPYDIDTFDIILVSGTTWGDISSTLKTQLKETEANVLLLNQDILTALAMASSGSTSTQTYAYSNSTTQVGIYNYNNSNPHWDEIIGYGNYHTTTADVYLWKNASAVNNNSEGVFFHYDATDILGGVPATHGSRTFLGYLMDGVYWNDDTNMGAMPVPQADWFDPIRHLTQAGKLYLDQAIQKAASGCNIEDCANGIDDDGDGLIDCDDPDCQVAPPSSINND